MTSVIKKELVEKKVSTLPFLPEAWEAGVRYGYKLDLKMCHIKSLVYDFTWADDSMPTPSKATVIHTPEKVLVLDASLNELTAISHEHLAMMPQLRVLDLSLNRIHRFLGVEVLKWLYHLNLSHNFITSIEGLANCRLLAELNLSMNQISDISLLPPLSNLSVLRVNNNQLQSLDGVQGLSGLKELYCQRNNICDLLPLCGTLRLITLNASDNNISSLHDTVTVLKDLRYLRSAMLYGNPIDKEYNYHNKIMEATSITGLDNVNIKPPPRTSQESLPLGSFTIKDAARQAFMDQLRDRKIRMQQQVDFFQARIQEVQQDYREFEDKLYQDLEACLRYMDNLGPDQVDRYDVSLLRGRLEAPAARPWEQVPYIPLAGSHSPSKESPRKAPPRGHKDYTGVKETHEVLRHAYNELIEQFPHGTPDNDSNSPTW